MNHPLSIKHLALSIKHLALSIKHSAFSIQHLALSIILLLLLSACSKEDDPISHRYPCRFYFYNNAHSTSLVFSAYRSAGMYVYMFTSTGTKGERYVHVQSNDGKTPEEKNLLTIAEELPPYNPFMLGAKGELGVIVGCTNFNGPTAYDRICPNCATFQPLYWTKNNRTQVECLKCKRTYDLETSYVVSGADGERLMRYAVKFDGTRLEIGN